MSQSSLLTDSHTCPWWLVYTFDNPLRRLIHNPTRILGPYVNPGDTVLDIGCGMGYFSLGLAELVGETGQVIAADLQAKMLAGLQKRAKRAGCAGRITTHQVTPGEIGLEEPCAFVLAFWMLHEVREPESFLHEVYELLEPRGHFLIAEPKIHVSAEHFEESIMFARRVGFEVAAQPRVRASRAVLLRKRQRQCLGG